MRVGGVKFGGGGGCAGHWWLQLQKALRGGAVRFRVGQMAGSDWLQPLGHCLVSKLWMHHPFFWMRISAFNSYEHDVAQVITLRAPLLISHDAKTVNQYRSN